MELKLCHSAALELGVYMIYNVLYSVCEVIV